MLSRMPLPGTAKKGLVFIVSAPAGTGKTTLVHRLLEEFPSVVRSVSFTTRPPRDGEVHGSDYHFLTRPEFEEKVAAEEFLEYVQLYNDYYGTSKSWVENQLNQGRHVVLVIDVQGALKLKKVLDAVYIFIKPPSLDVLRKRLVNRRTESLERIEQRLEWANKEIEEARHYDYQIVNDDLDAAYQVLRSILIAEEHKNRG